MAPPPPVEQTHRKTRFVSVIAATIIAIACGTNYAYSAWAPQYAERMQLSATQSNVIGNAGNIGMYAIGIPSGLLIDNKGPRWGVLLGLVLLACGYFPLRSAYLEGPGSYSVSMLSFLLFLTGVGSCSAFSAALKVSATNWPQHRGTATAFPLSAFGLSALFFTTVSGFAFPDSTGDYLLLLAVGTTCLVSVGMIFLKIIRPESHYEAVPGDDRPGISRKDSNQMHRTKSPHSRQSSGKQRQFTLSPFPLATTPYFIHLSPSKRRRNLFPRLFWPRRYPRIQTTRSRTHRRHHRLRPAQIAKVLAAFHHARAPLRCRSNDH